MVFLTSLSQCENNLEFRVGAGGGCLMKRSSVEKSHGTFPLNPTLALACLIAQLGWQSDNLCGILATGVKEALQQHVVACELR